MDSKIKVALICHVSNEYIRKNIDLHNHRFKNFIKKIIGRPTFKYKDYSTWNTILLEEFNSIENIEIHAIIPHPGLKHKLQKFNNNNIYYYFIKEDQKRYENNIFNDYKKHRTQINKLIIEIKPDIVHLIGAESPFISLSALDVETNNLPLLVSMQTALSDPDFLKMYPIISKEEYDERTKVEQAVLKKANYIGTDSSWYRSIAKKYNPTAKFVRYHFCTKFEMNYLNFNIKKEYDFVYFAVNIGKAGEDVLKIFSIAQKKNPNISLNLIGGYTQKYYQHLNNIIQKENIKNVTFSGYFEKHQDALQQVLKSKFALVPIKIDIISGTIREAMALGLPVITYITKGTPSLNKQKSTVLLSPIGDYKGMAENMIHLINSVDLQQELIKNSKDFINTYWDTKKNIEILAKTYRAIYMHHNTGVNLPIAISEAIY